MELIDKNTIIIEIDRRISNFKNEKSKDGASKTDKLDLGARIASLEELKVFINTFELKEVDLNKEFDKCCENWMFDDESEALTAKHFFKLGFRVQKGK